MILKVAKENTIAHNIQMHTHVSQGGQLFRNESTRSDMTTSKPKKYTRIGFVIRLVCHDSVKMLEIKMKEFVGVNNYIQ